MSADFLAALRQAVLLIPLRQAGRFPTYTHTPTGSRELAMKDQTYGLLAALLCVALAVAGIYYLTADTPIWNDWKSGEKSTIKSGSPAPPASGKELTDRFPETES